MLTNLSWIFKSYSIFFYSHFAHQLFQSSCLNVYNRGPVYMGSSSMDSTKLGSKIFRKKKNTNFSESSEKQNLFYCECNIYIAFTLCQILQAEKATAPHSSMENPMNGGAWWAAVHGVAKSRTRLTDFTFTFHFYALEKEMATHSSVLAWKSQGRGSLVGCRLWGCTESDMTEATQQQQQADITVFPRWHRHGTESALQCWRQKIPWGRN